MKTGAIIREFATKDGHRVVLRTPKWEDLDDLLEFINSLIEERADIIRAEKVSREEEIEWLSKVFSRQERGEMFCLVAEINGHVVANSEIIKGIGYAKHVGVIAISVKKGFRDLGIGTEMIKSLVEQANKWSLKVLTLSVFATNERAIHVYKKLGFIETGRIPRKFFKDGKYIDEIIMTKLLE